MNEFCAAKSNLIAKASVIMTLAFTSKPQPKGKCVKKDKKTKPLGKLVALGVAKIGNLSRNALPKGKCFHCGKVEQENV
jgi:hypothetical protein